MTTSGKDERIFRMSRRGRPIDPHFEPSEFLYRRCAIKDIDPQYSDRLYPDQIAFYPNWSVNRGKHSEWDDVLYPAYANYGVARFSVGDVPVELISESGVCFHWRLNHRPLEENYSHSEVWSFKEGNHIPNNENPNAKLPSLIKKKFRQLLCERAEIIKSPMEE